MERKELIFILILLITTFSAGAQDIIQKTNGEEVHCLVVDVSPGVVKYQLSQEEGSPVFSIAVDQVHNIRYSSGKVITYQHDEPPTQEPEQVNMQEPAKPFNTFGWQFGIGGSNIYGDLEGSSWQMATSIGASFNLALGLQNTLMLGANILGLGCKIDDQSFYNYSDSAYIEITNLEQSLGQLGLDVMYRQYFNEGRNYYAQGGFYGALILNAEWQGEVTVTDTNGYVYTESFHDDLRDFYGDFDYGLSFGIGGRVPIDKKGKWSLTLEARFNYGLANIINKDYLIGDSYRESNIFGMVFIGMDLPTNTSD